MKRLITLFIGLLLITSSAWANEEYDVTLEKGNPKGVTIELPYVIISFRLVEQGSNNRVLVSLDNTTTSQAILLFKNSLGEKALIKSKPKIEFEKKYPGSKGNRNVFGCKELDQSMVAIIPEDKMELFGINISSTSTTKLEVPLYLAKYDSKKLKKGIYNLNYKILNEEILNFNIKLKGWSENDLKYVVTKSAVENYIHLINSVSFCKNKIHTPTLTEQQKPYKEKKDSLINVIETIVETNGWMSDTAPYKAYKALRENLEKVNLNDHTYDCGAHKVTPKLHSCGYCSLSTQQIYHQLDDLYQQLRNGKLTKGVALKKAQGLYTCYQKNGKRKKDSSYSDKISKFYSRIVNY